MAAGAPAPKVRIPAIAIHGVGNHPPGSIAEKVKRHIGDYAAFDLSVREFNWDQDVDHGAPDSASGAFRNLQRVASNLHATATIALASCKPGLDAWLSRAQVWLCRLLRHFIVSVVTAMVATPAIILVVLLPVSFLQIGPVFPGAELRSLASALVTTFIAVTLCLAAGILALGAARSGRQLSPAPVRSSITCVVLTCVSPLVVFLSVPLSVSWPSVGMLVGFFSAAGLVFSVIEFVMPDVPAYTMWRDFKVAPYLLTVLGLLAGLEGARILFARRWYGGPIKILLDIVRYVGDPGYRHRTLEHLDRFIREAQAGSEYLVLVAHSLGSVIALDYLRNWHKGRQSGRVWLITLGSPYRRFFLRWLPGVLFERSTNQTAAAIARTFGTFHWINVFRPWDYVGTSLQLRRNSAGLDRSTGQYLRVNGHSDYWSDPAVSAAIRAALNSVAPALERTAALSRPPYWTPGISHPSKRAGRNLTGAFLFGLAALGVLWITYSVVARNMELARVRAEIDAGGIRREVRVTHRIIPDVAGELMYAHQFTFIADGLHMPPFQVSPYVPTSTAQHRLDYRKLQSWVRKDCELAKPAKWYTGEDSINCTSRTTATIAYLPPVPEDRFYLPGFEPQFYYRDLDGWVLFPLLIFGFSLLPAWPFATVTAACYSALLGDEAALRLTQVD